MTAEIPTYVIANVPSEHQDPNRWRSDIYGTERHATPAFMRVTGNRTPATTLCNKRGWVVHWYAREEAIEPFDPDDQQSCKKCVRKYKRIKERANG